MPAYGFVGNRGRSEALFKCGDRVYWITGSKDNPAVHDGIVASKSAVNPGCWLVIEEGLPGHLVLREEDIALSGEDETTVARRRSRQRGAELYPTSNTLPGMAAKEKEDKPRRRRRHWCTEPDEVRDIAMELFGSSYHTAKLESSSE